MLNAWIRRLTREKDVAADDEERQARLSFVRPIGYVAMSLLWLGLLPMLALPEQTAHALLFVAKLIATVGGVWGAYRLVDLIATHFTNIAERTSTRFDDVLVPMLRRSAKILVTAVGVIFIADNMGVQIWGLLAGVSIGGVAVALAAKDTVENLFGSVTVLTDQPFQIGDWVVIGDVEGTVEQIGFRSTRVRTFYNSLISVPNAKLTTATIDNMGRRQYRRFKQMLSIEYSTPPAKVEAFCEAVRELVRLHPYTRKDYYMVYLSQFGASSIDVLLYVFHAVPDWATEMRERHRLLTDIMRVARRLGVDFAFPTQTLHVETMPGMPGAGGGFEQESSADDVLDLPALRVDPQRHADTPDDIDDAVTLGREVARQIVAETWGEGTQAPVAFTDKDSIRSARWEAEQTAGAEKAEASTN
jgi:MscS family membrane protein